MVEFYSGMRLVRFPRKDYIVMYKNFAFLIIFLAFILLLPHVVFCDILRLKEIPEGKEGSEVEILEEKDDSFIIKIPKNEIKVIKRERPTEMKFWQEKRILWEDTGDYITLYLPKEKIVLPKDYTGDEYDSAKALKEKLGGSAAEGRPQEAAFWKGAGKIVGRIVKAGQPLLGAKVKIVNVSSSGDMLAKIFGPKDTKSQDLVFEVATDEFGRYEFTNIPIGEYDIYWALPGSESWYRRLSEKPNITVRPGETVEYQDIEINPSLTE